MAGEAYISVIVVSYCGMGYLRACLCSIPESISGGRVEVIVVDNASSDGAPEMVEREFPHVRLIRGSRNIGFAGGNNVGLGYCRGEYIMLLNPDAELLSGSLETCASYLDVHPSVSVVAPRIENPDGTLQFSLRNFPSGATALFELFFGHRVLPGLSVRFGEMIVDPSHYSEDKPIAWASGAAFVARGSVFREIGGLDERFFLFCEETDWFLRLARRGMTAVYLPGAIVKHRSSDGRNPELMQHATRSRLLYARKNLDLASRAVVSAALIAGSLARMLAWSLISLAGGARAKSQARAYRIGLISAFVPGGNAVTHDE